MNRLSTSNSERLVLSPIQLTIAVMVVVIVCAVIHVGWFRWEGFEPGPDYRLPCWAERMSDYWSFGRWSQYARSRLKVYVLGDSVVWGQEVTNDQTISHFLNEMTGKETFANMGIDGLHPGGIYGLVKYHGTYLKGKHVLLQFNPFWLSSRDFDLQGDWKGYFHPRLVPLTSRRIHYQAHGLNKRIGYLCENHLPILSLARHITVNYFDNTSVNQWMVRHPYRSPFSAMTLQAAPLIKDAPGSGRSWEEKGQERVDSEWLSPSQSVQWRCFQKALRILRRRQANVYVLLGPYNPYILTTSSQEDLQRLIMQLKDWFDAHNFRYFEANEQTLPSDTFADQAGHLLTKGHVLLAEALLESDDFRNWIAEP